MASIINTSNIDTAYPIAGQDNDSQGFRDNFTNINDNFIAAKNEIEDMQGKAILKSALNGGTLDNDMAGALISNAQIQGFRGTVVNHGAETGSVVIDVSAGPYQKLSTGGSIDLSFLNFAASGTHSAVTVEIEVTDVAHTITLPVEAALEEELVGASGSVITATETGTYVYEFSTTDSGSSIIVSTPTQAGISRRVELVGAPAASVGASGDRKGMVAYDASYIYICTADYDGVSSIWIRSSAAAW